LLNIASAHALRWLQLPSLPPIETDSTYEAYHLGMSPIPPERSDSDSSDRLVAADILLRQEPDEEEDEEEDQGDRKEDDNDEEEDDAGWSERSLISWVKDEA
jgi:hypothetical protein